MANAVKRAAQDHERPAFAHGFQCRRQPTFDNVAQRLSQFTHRSSSSPQLTRLRAKNQTNISFKLQLKT